MNMLRISRKKKLVIVLTTQSTLGYREDKLGLVAEIFVGCKDLSLANKSSGSAVFLPSSGCGTYSRWTLASSKKPCLTPFSR